MCRTSGQGWAGDVSRREGAGPNLQLGPTASLVDAERPGRRPGLSQHPERHRISTGGACIDGLSEVHAAP
jgi:hypothetical protein